MRAQPYNGGIKEIKHHLHSKEFWFGLAATPNGTIHRTDHISLGTAGAPIAPFRIDGGDNTWGAWVQILGTGDGAAASQVAFDPHRVLVVDAERTSNTYAIQVAYGTGTEAEALASFQYTEILYRALATGNTEVPITVQSAPIYFGNKVWVRCWSFGANTGTLDFYWAAHGYTADQLG